ncbi:hypothetical protein LTR53_003286 [Teratosphaeriaceae sp. CCFEE 6253]|nr:hypothetical protein LTR53_003286 [Teratosphaeriaceae sp. CCFEE 6253]
MYPYCRHIREMDLQDLGALLDRLDEAKFRKVTKQFFAGDLNRFHHVVQTTGKYRASRLDFKQILIDVGDLITQQAPMLEAISEPASSDVLSSALPAWIPRLSHLHELNLWDGKALEDETMRNLLHVHCPRLRDLTMFSATGSDPDHYLAGFIGGMPDHALTSFYNISTCSIGPETCLALNAHGRSLRTLKLQLETEGVLALSLLQSCTQLQTLHLSSSQTPVDLKATQNDVYLSITEWLKQCGSLTDISIRGLVSAPDLLLPILLNEDVALANLEISGGESSLYQAKDHHDFHKALGTQSGLQSLLLRADPDPMTRDDVEAVLDGLCRLTGLRELNLLGISDYLSDHHIETLAQHLKRLVTIYIGGYGITDAVFNDVATLKHLKSITFAGLTSFTIDGILAFIDQLGDGNAGFVLSVDMADPDTMISEEGQELLRERLADKLGGRFDYQPLRGAEKTSGGKVFFDF